MSDTIVVVDQNTRRMRLLGRFFTRSGFRVVPLSSPDALMMFLACTLPQGVVVGTGPSDGLVETVFMVRAIRKLWRALPIITLVTPAQRQALHPVLAHEERLTLLNGHADAVEWIPELLHALPSKTGLTRERP